MAWNRALSAIVGTVNSGRCRAVGAHDDERQREEEWVPESLTKRRIDEGMLRVLVAEAFGPDAVMAGFQELREGYFNAAFRIQLADGRDTVLKASPPSNAALLTYEHDIMHAEAEFFRQASTAGVPQPRLLHAGFERTVIDGDYVFLSAVDGVSWYSVREELDDEQTDALRRELGSIVARLHTVRNPRGLFGYPAVPALSADTWPEAFAAMFGAIVVDASRYSVKLPVGDGELLGAVARNIDALAEVTEPVLVHFDLWPGNILITPPGGAEGPGGGSSAAPRINGLIDGERMIWGDPLLEFVGIAVFGREEQDEAIRAGYLEAGGTIDASDAGRRRLTLYHLYIQLVILTEMGPRGYTDQDYLDFFGTECPKRIVAALAELG
jgi:aminoglycoside phosphotransferase (APT) family kinase protein